MLELEEMEKAKAVSYFLNSIVTNSNFQQQIFKCIKIADDDSSMCCPVPTKYLSLNISKCFGRAIELAPSVGHSKYMYMGQLMTGEVAVQCFMKGIEIMKKVLKSQQKQVRICNFQEQILSAY